MAKLTASFIRLIRISFFGDSVNLTSLAIGIRALKSSALIRLSLRGDMLFLSLC